jgi:hypothetical protein
MRNLMNSLATSVFLAFTGIEYPLPAYARNEVGVTPMLGSTSQPNSKPGSWPR